MKMVKNKQSLTWMVDAALLILMLVEFFADLTGISLHQWMGVLLGGLAAYHLVTHWRWIRTVVNKFIHGASLRSRRNFLLDASIGLGLITILISGLVISTWFDLPLSNYYNWKTFHVTISVLTLILVVLKIGLHWKWIIKTASSFRVPAGLPRSISTKNMPSIAATGSRTLSTPLSRRSFLSLMGIVGAASFIAIREALAESNPLPQIAEITSESLPKLSTPENSSTSSTDSTSSSDILSSQLTDTNGQLSSVNQATSTPAGTSELTTTTETSTPEVIAESSPTAVATATAINTAQSETCQILCDQHCSFPGRCRRYTDQNNNGRCDLGECL
jgi:uncharacterized membrane protein